ncbi:histone deacetylase family protein [Agaribacter marinus]|uniref:Histone deacetylase n=1 Tax=Agaribacter marinus TaxID=1431249 RepID=A0AA37SYY5_9ALTE|nr:histone deacetylase [Agaribacter marinus]GLR72867.1 histone deacetylase [Agaribacter marinus]
MTALVFHPIYSQLDLPTKHRFPIQKYQALKDRLISLGVSNTRFYKPKALDPAVLSKIFDPSYIKNLTAGTLEPAAMKKIGFPWSEQLILRTLTASAGTILAGELALQQGRAINLTGGYHHAFGNFGAGFCMINDLYLCALNMLQHASIRKILIFDCDVHQGDGTAKLAQNNASVFTVSIHGEKNFPHNKQRSNLDFPLPKGTRDNEYLLTVKNALELAIEEAKPDAVIYDAGVDVHENDDLGHLDVSTIAIYQRDRFVFEKCKALNLPLIAVIGGGYQRDINSLTNVHLQLFKAADVI